MGGVAAADDSSAAIALRFGADRSCVKPEDARCYRFG